MLSPRHRTLRGFPQLFLLAVSHTSRPSRCVPVNLFPARDGRGQTDNFDMWPARITAALVFLIQLLGGEGKGEVRGQGTGYREQGRGN